MMLAWGAKVSPPFRLRVSQIATDLGCDPSDMMAVMAFESNLDPTARNSITGATGLIQFMPATAKGLGTTVEALAGMTAEQQLEYVARYYAPYKGRLANLGDTYMAVLFPPGVGKPDDWVAFYPSSREYLANRGLDLDHDGSVTRGECVAFPAKRLAEGMQHAAPIVDEQEPAPITDESTQADQEPAVPIAIPLLMQLIPQVIGLFSGRAQATIAEKTGADPKVAEQFMQGLIQKVGDMVGVPATDDASAIQAVAALQTQVKQQADKIKELEDKALDFLHDLTEAALALVDVRKQEVAIDTASMDAASVRQDAQDIRQNFATMAWRSLAVGAVLLGAVAVAQIVYSPTHTADGQIVGALILAFGALVSSISMMGNFGFGSTGSSGAKDLVISQMAKSK